MTPRYSAISALFARLARALLALAPAAYRRRWTSEVATTVRDACLAAGERRGVSGVMACGIAELLDIAARIARLRTGRHAAITGGITRHRASRVRPLSTLARDLRNGVRSLRTSRLQTAVSVLTLALGIGLNAAVFSVLDAVLFRPLPFVNADRLVALSTFYPASGLMREGMPRGVFLQWRRERGLFDRVEGYDRRQFIYADPNGAETIQGVGVTPGLLSLLGAAPAAGRTFIEGDGRGGTDHAVIVSDAFWHERLHGPASLFGVSIVLNDVRYAVVGVMPASFRFPDELEEIWVPYDPAAPPADVQVQSWAFVPIARLAPGVSRRQAQEQVMLRGTAVSAAGGGDPRASAKADVPGLFVDEVTRKSLFVLGGAAAFLLLIVCANLANLSLARALPRTRDCAIRAALGASRASLVRESCAASLAIGALGTIAGIIVARAGIDLAVAAMPPAMTTHTFNVVMLDWRVATVTVVIGVLTSLLFGLPPALVASRASVTDVLRRDTRSASGSPLAQRVRAAIVVAEVSLSIVLLVGAALMTRSLMKLQAVDKGLDPDGLVALRLGLPGPRYADEHLQNQLLRSAVEQIRAVPGVTAATIGTVPPDLSAAKIGPIEHAGGIPAPAGAPGTIAVAVYQVPADFFRALGIPIVEGRVFREDDRDGAVLVSRSFARQQWPGGGALGARFRLSGDDAWMSVVGVAATVQDGARTARAQIYMPFGRHADLLTPVRPSSSIAAFRTLVVRAADPAAVLPSLAAAVHAVDPQVVVDRREIVAQRFADAIARPRIVFVLMAVFAGVALVLAGAGIYGVLSCLVAQRLREIGIRLAMGADVRDVGRLVLINGLGLSVAGLVAGVGLALGLVRIMRTLLYQVEPTDVASIAAVAGLVLVTALAASWRPVRRAMRVDAIALLREE
jgi:putative ABC transport system permease protein